MNGVETGEDISLEDSNTHSLHGIVLHTALFQDVGLVWPQNKPASAEFRTVQVDDSALADMGLPTSFGTSKYSTDEASNTFTIEEADPSEWQQAYDPVHHCYYYYRASTQETQWEPPSVGFRSLPTAPEKDSIEVTSPYVAAVESYKMAHGWYGDIAADQQMVPEPEDQKGQLAPRKETTGMLPAIPPPQGMHVHFGDDGEPMEMDEYRQTEDLKDEEGKGEEDDEEGVDNEPIPCISNKKKKVKKPRRRNRGFRPSWLPSDVPTDLQKYWLQRYSLFKLYDQGIRLDRECWYSVTPEIIARHHAARFASTVLGPNCIVVDAFAGVGGNAIQLARVCKKVIAIELDPHRVELLKHNALVYGVADRIESVVGDFFKVVDDIKKADLVFFSPPWGGPRYSRKTSYDAEITEDANFGISNLLNIAFKKMGCSGVALYLPRNTRLHQLGEVAEKFSTQCEVEREVLNGIFKAITAYYGSLSL